MLNNPFIVGRPITHEEFFVGRTPIKQTILGALSNLGSTCVIGERRTGKTSLLLEIQRQIRKMGSAPLCVYMDCSDTPTIESFWTEFISQLRVEASGQIGQLVGQIESLSMTAKFDVETVADRVIKTVSSSQSIILLLDEFDYILENEAFAGSFLLRLRKYGSLHNVAFVTASRQRLETHYSSPTPSPFFNIFLVAILGPFSEREGLSLLNKRLPDGTSAFNRDEINYLLSVSGCYPFFLQLAASILFIMKYGGVGELDANWRSMHKGQFEAAAQQHFEYFWRKSSIDEKSYLLELAKGNVLGGRKEVTMSLLERSVVALVGNQYRLFSPVWAEWIIGHTKRDTHPQDYDQPDHDELLLKQDTRQIDQNTSGTKNSLSLPLGSVHDRSRAKINILFLAVNPKDLSPLRSDEEARDIEIALRQTALGERYVFSHYSAVRISDLQTYLLRHKPDIVHFSGHGSRQGEIVLEDSDGQSKPVPGSALSKLFGVLKDNIRCVVLNACFSEDQAKTIAESIDCVIGVTEQIDDISAVTFAVAFYRTLGFGRDIQTAFELGCLAITMEGLSNEDIIPKLICMKGNPKDITLVSP